MKRLIIFLFLLQVYLPSMGSTYFMKPQARPAQGPWFEGWYFRVTDPEQRRSFAIIVSSLSNSKAPLSIRSILPGYVAFLLSPNAAAKTESLEFFPQSTWLENTSQDFIWKAQDIGQFSEHEIKLNLPSGDKIEVQFGPRWPWSPDSNSWGPNGLAAFFNFLPLQWYVDSLGSATTYKITRANGETLLGHGYTHMEKNWGPGFPKAWIWAQATSPDNQSHIAFAGGPLKFGPLTVTSYLVGYKSPKYDVEIRPDQLFDSSYYTKIDAKNGQFSLRAENSEYSVHIHAQADPKSFAFVSIPTTLGFLKNKGIESFSSLIEVELWQHGSLLETQYFYDGALEFGGDYITESP